MYSSSVLANSERWQTFRPSIYSLFVVLLSVHKTDSFEIHFQHLAKQLEELGKTKDRANYLIDDNLKLDSNNFKTNLLHELDSIHEEKHYQQSKRSLYYKDCLEDFKRAKREIKKSTTIKLNNSLYCPQYAGYLLNNWTGLASLWTNIHLKDQAKRSQKKLHLDWSNSFSDRDCVINPLRTQGIIELYQKLTKHVTLSTKTQRVDSVIADLKLKKILSLRMFEINTSRIGKPLNLASEKYGKQKKRKFTYQESHSCDAKLNKLFEGATKTEPTEKKKKEQSKLKIRFNFRNKNKRNEVKKSESKQDKGLSLIIAKYVSY